MLSFSGFYYEYTIMNPNDASDQISSVPLLSIITVTLNNAEGLEKTIRSVIGQTMKSHEFIVIDGGSKDTTPEIIARYKNFISKYVSEPDNGIYDAMNKGMSFAKGKYLNFLNAGDVYHNLQTLDNIFKPIFRGNYDLIYGDMMVCESNNNDGHLQKAYPFSKKNFLKVGTGVVCHQAVFIKSSIAPRYNGQWRFKAELNWYFDILDSGQAKSILHVDTPVVRYALGGFGQVNFWKNQREWVRLIRHRYGTLAIMRYGIPLRILLKMPYRYKWMRRMYKH